VVRFGKMFFDFNLYFELLEYLLRQNSAIICRQIVETYVFFFANSSLYFFHFSVTITKLNKKLVHTVNFTKPS
jgi:hypothetical protein